MVYVFVKKRKDKCRKHSVNKENMYNLIFLITLKSISNVKYNIDCNGKYDDFFVHFE